MRCEEWRNVSRVSQAVTVKLIDHMLKPGRANQCLEPSRSSGKSNNSSGGWHGYFSGQSETQTLRRQTGESEWRHCRHQGGRSTGSSLSWRSNSTCCAACSAFNQCFFCHGRNHCPGRCHSNFTWIETFPAKAWVRCSSVSGRKSSQATSAIHTHS
jgi:hypothetical protein